MSMRPFIPRELWVFYIRSWLIYSLIKQGLISKSPGQKRYSCLKCLWGALTSCALLIWNLQHHKSFGCTLPIICCSAGCRQSRAIRRKSKNGASRTYLWAYSIILVSYPMAHWLACLYQGATASTPVQYKTTFKGKVVTVAEYSGNNLGVNIWH